MSLNCILSKCPHYYVHRFSSVLNKSTLKSNYSSLSGRITLNGIKNLRYKSNASGFEDLDKPIKFTTSEASKWDSRRTFGNDPYGETPEIQMYSIIFSLTAFLVYFCILREENDIDEEMNKTLWERIPGLEKNQLKVVYNYNVNNDLDNTAVLARLQEIEELEAKQKAESLAQVTK